VRGVESERVHDLVDLASHISMMYMYYIDVNVWPVKRIRRRVNVIAIVRRGGGTHRSSDAP